ncbi:MAG: UDP-N-acetylglucosamine 2-epimerase (non-hydrolyzing) [Acidobacteria bacterium]|nr:MAG: UDP-N-acetylglucosamine 2-epimerase (non-hydrolyzing) [Acidobacteriota bacterium]PYV28229.1 MAG: UDP-N-acetylglucosamine 2-epimerase (non-hydrolyzing) [Acidobacteriota bacterium]
MKFISVVGARPNFMKVAPLVAELGGVAGAEHLLVHSGQHYDEQLSASFFRDLGLPEPDINLQVGSGSHAWQTAEIMKRLEPVLVESKPDVVLVVGDVNSTLAAAITAAKLRIRLAHVEAGLRSFDPSMPEEINRKVTDVLSDLLFVSEESGVENLRREGIPEEKIFLVGNVMIDSLLGHRDLAARSGILEELNLARDGSAPDPYAVLTLHRPSNVDDPHVLGGILKAVSTVARELPVLFPVHPRTRERIETFGYGHYFSDGQTARAGLVALRSLGYLEFLCLMDHARLLLTDSGGIQEETTALGVPCLTLRENTERPATIRHGTNQLVGSDPERLVAAARKALQGDCPKGRRPPLWDGQAATRIVKILLQRLRPCSGAL